MQKRPIKNALLVLEKNIENIARVNEWALFMGYENPKLFSRHFIKYYRETPIKVMNNFRIIKVIEELRSNQITFRRIAWKFNMPDEKALNNFINYHTGQSPSNIIALDDQEVHDLLEKLRSKIKE